jgi:hypothetical protein
VLDGGLNLVGALALVLNESHHVSIRLAEALNDGERLSAGRDHPVAVRPSMWTFGMPSADAISDGLPTVLSLVAELCAPIIFLGGQAQSARR